MPFWREHAPPPDIEKICTKNLRTKGSDHDRRYFMGSETIPSACLPFYSTSNGYYNIPAKICLCERGVKADYMTKKETEISEYLPLFIAQSLLTSTAAHRFKK